jgi:hypothetical protein
MRKSNLVSVAEFKRIVIDKEDLEKVKRQQADFRQDFQVVVPALKLKKAHEYIKLR